jgi:hypothetical protein
MKLRNVVILIVLLVVLSSVITAIVIDMNNIIQAQRYPMDVEVKNDKIIGINVDPDGFHFGSLYPGGGASRILKIHQIEEDAMVNVIKKGEMAEWVGNPDDFIIRKGEDMNISLSISIPKDAEFGNYIGEVIFILRKLPKNE